MTMDTSLKESHDILLSEKPEGAHHNEAECPFCLSNDTGEHMKTFSEEEVQALVQTAVATATAALQTELDEIKGSEEAKAVEAKIAEARAEAEEKVADLQARLDEAVLEATAAKSEKDEILAWLENEKDAAEAAAMLEARREERVAQVAEVAAFPQEYVQENADRWAGLEDEAFEALLRDYKAVAEKAGAHKDLPQDDKIPSQTAMKAARETDTGSKGNAYREVFALRRSGVDLRSI